VGGVGGGVVGLGGVVGCGSCVGWFVWSVLVFCVCLGVFLVWWGVCGGGGFFLGWFGGGGWVFWLGEVSFCFCFVGFLPEGLDEGESKSKPAKVNNNWGKNR